MPYKTRGRLDVDVRLVAESGVLRQCNFKGKVCLDESGRPSRFIGTIIDITERKRAEEERDFQRIQLQAVLSSIADGGRHLRHGRKHRDHEPWRAGHTRLPEH